MNKTMGEKMRSYNLISDIPEVRAIRIYRGSSIGDLVNRKTTRFVKNGSYWLVESNGKVFSNVVDGLQPKWGFSIQYKSAATIQKLHVYELLVDLLAAARLISKNARAEEFGKIEKWRDEQKTNRSKTELLSLAEKLGIRLSPAQVSKIGGRP